MNTNTPKSTITTKQYAVNARQLAAAIMLQATRDYCKSRSESKRAEILKDLRSTRMDFITDGLSQMIADQLENHPDEIAERMKQSYKDVV